MSEIRLTKAAAEELGNALTNLPYTCRDNRNDFEIATVTIRADDPSGLKNGVGSEKATVELGYKALTIHPKPEEPRDGTDWICPVCDGGPGNDGACSCPK